MRSWLAFSLQYFGEVIYTHGERGKMWLLFEDRMGGRLLKKCNNGTISHRVDGDDLEPCYWMRQGF